MKKLPIYLASFLVVCFAFCFSGCAIDKTEAQNALLTTWNDFSLNTEKYSYGLYVDFTENNTKFSYKEHYYVNLNGQGVVERTWVKRLQQLTESKTNVDNYYYYDNKLLHKTDNSEEITQSKGTLEEFLTYITPFQFSSLQLDLLEDYSFSQNKLIFVINTDTVTHNFKISNLQELNFIMFGKTFRLSDIEFNVKTSDINEEAEIKEINITANNKLNNTPISISYDITTFESSFQIPEPTTIVT